MQIDRIFVSGWRGDLRYTQCCVASIRQWYPAIRICLIKDELAGNYDTSVLERAFDVEIFDSSPKLYGWGTAKLEPLFQPHGERFLIIDSDVVFIGPVLKKFQSCNEDFVVVHEDHPQQHINENYFDPQEVERLYPPFRYPGYVFNTGQFVARGGILKRSDFERFLSFGRPPKFLLPDVFKCAEQGLLNFVLLGKHQTGKLSLGRAHFMRWPPGMKAEEIELARLGPDSPYDFLLHWAGRKDYPFEDAPLSHVLLHFDAIYNRRAGRDAFRRRFRFWEKRA